MSHTSVKAYPDGVSVVKGTISRSRQLRSVEVSTGNGDVCVI